jgi:CO/xanthine dehydrogenase Mo-binding subunit
MVATVPSRARGGVGESVRRVEAIPKVTGTFDYASDLWADGMLWGATLRSPHPHARIRRVDTATAASLPDVRIEGTLVFTNNPPCGAMRGFRAPQVCFGHEAQMDKLAAALHLDPVELRLRNALHTGSVLPTGQVLTGSAPVREPIELCARAPMPAREPAHGRDQLDYPGGTGNVTHGEGLAIGVGYAVRFKNTAFSEGFDDSAALRVTLSLDQDSPVAEIHTAAVEMGQGLTTVLTQIARTELGVGHVLLHAADTSVGNAGSTSASRQSMMAGGAVQLACRQIRERLAAQGGLLAEPVTETAVYHHRPTTGFDSAGQVTPDDLTGLRPPRATGGPPPVPDVPGQWPVPYYHNQVSAQQRLM